MNRDSYKPGPLPRRSLLRMAGGLALTALPLAMGLQTSAQAQERSAMQKIRDSGVLKIALYKENAPWSDGSMTHMTGLDVSLGEALAAALQLKPALLPFDAGENMGDDLRNMVWKGHYLGYGPADVMLHVPVDKYFMGENRQAFIFAPYAREHLVVLHNPKLLAQVYNPEDLEGKKITTEQGTGASSAIMGYKGGLLRDRVSLFKSGTDAATAVLRGEADAAFVSLAQAEAAVFAAKLDRKDWAFSRLTLPGVPPNGWPLGLAVKADNKELAGLLDAALDTLRGNGQLLKIFQAQGLTLAAP
ncbi:ABC transporter permease [Rhodoferax lacus]|uniref:ABC transporter permease n=1 Tax=Rhodoferax lacus TaxID=2184758 RepID=A0A3E1RDL6_9BURK|nr:ABC transporter substrate-binding protein [Rhodoferax lacus]RFO97321.1 ABC transporter permease [Rhodoferax lacus]